jgi:phospholipase D1/2
MGALRDQVLRDLVAADRHRRLRLVYPAASRARNVSTFVHSKVMIVDDRLVRIGSANLSRRSMGVDSECDLAVEAVAVDAGAVERHRAGVRRIRDRLIGEHLGMSADEVAADVARLGSLRALVDARADADRTLLPIDTNHPVEPPPEILKAAADPDRPIDVEVVAGMTELIAPLDVRVEPGPIRYLIGAIAGLILLMLVLAIAGSLIFSAVSTPSWPAVLAAAAVGLMACVLAFVVRSLLFMRKAVPAERRQRERAEFG